MSIRSSISRRLEPLRGDATNYDAKTGAIVIGLIALVLIMAVTQTVPFLGGDGGRLVKAGFAAANQVGEGTPVRVAGVDVGAVESVEAGSSADIATVAMRITNEDLVLARDARADIRWRTVLGGNMYVDLQPGSPSAPELGEATIPVSQTSSQVELDDLAQIYDQGTGDQQRAMLRGFRDALSEPDAVGRSIETAGPALRTVGRGLRPLRGEHPDDLTRLVAAAAETFGGLGRNTAALEGLVTGAARSLAVPSARREDLGELIELAPPSLDSTATTMLRLDTTLGHLDPLVAKLDAAAPSIAPAADAATPMLAQTEALLRDARPLLRAAGPTLAALKRAGKSGVPLLDGLDPTIERLNDELLPYFAERDPSTELRNYEAIGPFFSSLSSVASPVNDAGHLLQFAVLFGPGSVLPLNDPPSGALERIARKLR